VDLRNMLVVSECVARAALERTESRGGHTRDDYPAMEPEWRGALLVCTRDTSSAKGSVRVERQDQVPMRTDLVQLFELDELKKYFTADELPGGMD
jgi:succinate dehydrogenase / fumarate reductase flavoprotein subunit